MKVNTPVSVVGAVLSLAAVGQSFSPMVMSSKQGHDSTASCSRAGFLGRCTASAAVAWVGGSLVGAEAAQAGYQYEFLTEPTAETRDIEERQAAFAKKMRAYRAEWVALENKVVEGSSDDDVVKGLASLRATLAAKGNLPEGRKPADLFKILRKKKGDFKDQGKWLTPVEIEYEALIREVNLSTRPDNTSGYRQL
jgi:hypothetical protein